MSDPSGKTYFALGCAYSALIAIVIGVVLLLVSLWALGIIGPAD